MCLHVHGKVFESKVKEPTHLMLVMRLLMRVSGLDEDLGLSVFLVCQ